MAKGILPSDPSRADHRMIRYMLTVFFKGKSPAHDPQEYDRVSMVFGLMGGSWERLFKGSVQDIDLLKNCLKVALEKGVISKSPKWR